ncbi:uncharacterized protein LOC131947034 [Physella acuta]|uniref:uncharacterized protein LOC131947034 n=1 Tax=Physella acuta TaxID=109671 RepID=UPI0027DD0DCE|nr:uncharacterized protein LOC131947034 [Physella acuta]
MGEHLGRLTTSWVLFGLAFCLVLSGLLTSKWLTVTAYFTKVDVHFAAKGSYSSGYDATIATAMWATLGASCGMAGMCFILANIMMFADCCSRVSECMTAIPKICVLLATLGGLLAEVGCTLFLIDLYVLDTIPVMMMMTVTPNISFYLTVAGGVIQMIGGCVSKFSFKVRVAVH